MGKGEVKKSSRERCKYSEEDRRRIAKEVLRRLKKHYKGATTELQWENPLQLLIATILSAQCTDARVNAVTKDLFKRYKTAEDFANANLEELQEEIKSTGFYRQKAKAIIGACKMIVEKFCGRVPDNMEDLIKLPGVARKTANVVLSTAFGKNEGIAVDTHVGRVAVRLGLVRTDNPKDADEIEKELMELFPQKDWGFVSHALILLGRYICKAKNPAHEICPLRDICYEYRYKVK